MKAERLSPPRVHVTNSRLAQSLQRVTVPPYLWREGGKEDIWEKSPRTLGEEVICSNGITGISVLGQGSLSLTQCSTMAVFEPRPCGSGTETQPSWP